MLDEVPQIEESVKITAGDSETTNIDQGVMERLRSVFHKSRESEAKFTTMQQAGGTEFAEWRAERNAMSAATTVLEGTDPETATSADASQASDKEAPDPMSQA